MNRREFLAGIVTVPVVASADCRDERGMIQPAVGTGCLDLRLNERDTGRRIMTTGRALFGFGAYEDLLRHHKEKRAYPFKVGRDRYLIKVARLSVDVDRQIGCVVCEVHGRIWT